MADGRTHAQTAEKVAIALSASAIPVGYYTNEAAALAIMAGAVCGWLMTPDLDIPHRTHEESRMWRLSPILGVIWQTYWKPYALLIPHRHWLSHAPGVGTAIRMLYIGWPLPLLVPSIDWWLVLSAFVAWSIQDVAHLAADGWRVKS